MKRAAFAAMILALSALAAWSQPKVAVLDAIIPQNMDPSVIVPVTEKIAERLVVSGRFTVLDRANIESVLKEREFQVSGMVSDQDVVTAGKYLGADFVVVAKVTKVGETYFISAKMIAIKTGVIANQTSAQGEGKLSTLINLAEQVGEVLSGGAVLAQSASGGQKDISKPDVEPGKKAEPKPKEPSAPGKSNFSVLLGFSYIPTTWKETYSMTYDGDVTEKLNYAAFDLGFETRYINITLAFGSQSSGTYDYFYNGSSTSSGDITDKVNYIGIGAFGKFPFQFGSITVFPIAGIEYFLDTSIKDSTGVDFSNSLSLLGEAIYTQRLFLEAGLGGDFAFGSKLFARGLFVFGYKIPSAADEALLADRPISFPGYTNGKISTTLLKAGLSIGYKL